MKTKFNFEIVFLQNLKPSKSNSRTQWQSLPTWNTSEDPHSQSVRKAELSKSLSFQQQEDREREKPGKELMLKTKSTNPQLQTTTKESFERWSILWVLKMGRVWKEKPIRLAESHKERKALTV